MGLCGMKRGEGEEWQTALEIAKAGGTPDCPECRQVLKVRRDEAIEHAKPIGFEVICHSCKKSIGT